MCGTIYSYYGFEFCIVKKCVLLDAYIYCNQSTEIPPVSGRAVVSRNAGLVFSLRSSFRPGLRQPGVAILVGDFKGLWLMIAHPENYSRVN